MEKQDLGLEELLIVAKKYADKGDVDLTERHIGIILKYSRDHNTPLDTKAIEDIEQTAYMRGIAVCLRRAENLSTYTDTYIQSGINGNISDVRKYMEHVDISEEEKKSIELRINKILETINQRKPTPSY